MVHKTTETFGKMKGAAKSAGQTLRGHVGIFSTLAKEHGEVSALMSRALKTDDVEERRSLYTKIRQELLSHAHAEDEVLYTRLSRPPETAGEIPHARKEHAEVEQLLNELQSMDPGHQSWVNKFEKLKSAVEHHANEEEQELFPQAQRVMDNEEARRLDDQYDIVKQGKMQHMTSH